MRITGVILSRADDARWKAIERGEYFLVSHVCDTEAALLEVRGGTRLCSSVGMSSIYNLEIRSALLEDKVCSSGRWSASGSTGRTAGS